MAFYSNIPGHMDHIKYLFVGLHGHNTLVPWMWSAIVLMVIAIFLLLIPMCRRNEGVLAVACVMLFIGAWIDKGMGMIAGGFVPNPLHQVTEYMPSGPEVAITLGVWAAGFIVLTILFKIATGVKEEAAGL